MTDKKVKLLKAHFDFEGAEVSYTTPEVGGAASGKNEAYMFKAMDMDSKESTDEVADTASDVGITGETADVSVSKTQETNEEDNKMSEEIQKQLEAAQAKIEKMERKEASDAFAKYELSEEVTEELVSKYLGDLEVVTKALDEMVAKHEEAIAKAKEVEVPETDIAKKLANEAGHEGTEPEADTSIRGRFQKYKSAK